MAKTSHYIIVPIGVLWPRLHITSLFPLAYYGQDFTLHHSSRSSTTYHKQSRNICLCSRGCSTTTNLGSCLSENPDSCTLHPVVCSMTSLEIHHRDVIQYIQCVIYAALRRLTQKAQLLGYEVSHCQKPPRFTSVASLPVLPTSAFISLRVTESLESEPGNKVVSTSLSLFR